MVNRRSWPPTSSTTEDPPTGDTPTARDPSDTDTGPPALVAVRVAVGGGWACAIEATALVVPEVEGSWGAETLVDHLAGIGAALSAPPRRAVAAVIRL